MAVWLWWSSGKDSAWALHELRQQGVEVSALVTTISPAFGRVAMHGVRVALLEAQAQAAGLPLHVVELPTPCTNDDYEAALAPIHRAAREQGVEMAYGDLFLEDIRQYRERVCRETGVQARFPLWGRDTDQLARDMLAGGLEARIVCLDPRRVSREHAGAAWDAAFLEAVGSRGENGVDPCGENGEFHTLVTAGPMLEGSIVVEAGEIVERDGFVFTDFGLAS